ncbi:hypothetical protein AHiyo8_53950 [Arthrobacter sp. Hiyo8]|nr:hypothetical protein AHiyo8_53950 [Arthrobacter sp. Hiyo8]
MGLAGGRSGPGTHVLRLSYGRAEGADAPGSAAAQSVASLNDDALLDAALRDASTLLTVPIVREDVLDWDVVRWAGPCRSPPSVTNSALPRCAASAPEPTA